MGLTGDAPEQKPEASGSYRSGGVPAKERAKQAALLEAQRARKARRAPTAAHLPGFASEMERRLRPRARRRARTARPLGVDIRRRKPCVLARLRRLG